MTEQWVSGPEGSGAEPLAATAATFPYGEVAREATLPVDIAPVPTGVVAFVGRCQKGPVNEPVPVGSFAEFQQIFGGLWEDSALPTSLEQFFEHGGRRALVVRVASSGRPPTIDLPAGMGHLLLTGLSPGRNEHLRASVDYDGISQQDEDLFNLVVQRVRRRGSELVETQEIFRRVSILQGSAREVGRMLTGSRLVRVAGPLPSRRPDITRGGDPRSLVGYAECNNDGEDGVSLSDYDLIGSESARSGLFALAGGPVFNFLYIPPTDRARDLGMSVLVVAARFCRRHHALLLVDPPLAWTTTQRALDGLRDWPFHSADSLMFFPRIVSTDGLSNRMEKFAPSAAAIALVVRDEETRGEMWREPEEPALLRPSAVPSLWVDFPQRHKLAQNGVNVLRSSRRAVREDLSLRTLAGEFAAGAAARWLCARRLELYACASIERGTRWVALEGNSPRSRERVARQIDRFLAELAEAGAFAGQERNRHYFVLCDERLNGPTLSQGQFRVIFGFQSQHAPTRQSWLVEHSAADSRTRAVSLNQLAALELL